LKHYKLKLLKLFVSLINNQIVLAIIRTLFKGKVLKTAVIACKELVSSP